MAFKQPKKTESDVHMISEEINKPQIAEKEKIVKRDPEPVPNFQQDLGDGRQETVIAGTHQMEQAILEIR